MSKLVNIYSNNCNKKLSKSKIRDILKHDIFWNADESILNGLVDDKWLGVQNL